MFVKFVVSFLFIALAFMIAIIIRQRLKKISGRNNERVEWSQTLKNLTLQQLKKEQFELEQKRISTSSGFINMNPEEKNEAIGRVAKINKKLEMVRQAIGNVNN